MCFQAVCVHVFWRSGFGGRLAGRRFDFFQSYTFRIRLAFAGFHNLTIPFFWEM